MAIAQHVTSIQSDNGQFALMTFSEHVIETVEGSITKPEEVLALLSVPMVRVFSILMFDPFLSKHSQTRPLAFTDLVEKPLVRLI
jgi:hypothetical protein